MTAISLNDAIKSFGIMFHDTIADSTETVIVSDNGSVVLINLQDWNNIQETLRLLRDKESMVALLESHKARAEGRSLKSFTVEEAFYDLQNQDS